MKFKKKPVEIEAFRMGIDPRPDWFTDKVTSNDIITYSTGEVGPQGFDKTYCEIHTLEGVMRGDFGDWIIQGVKGEVYPCKPDIFAMTYEIPDPLPPLEGVREAIRLLDSILCAHSDAISKSRRHKIIDRFEEALATLQGDGLRWTREKPKANGFYWIRQATARPIVEWLELSGSGWPCMVQDSGTRFALHEETEFAGPIAEPRAEGGRAPAPMEGAQP